MKVSVGKTEFLSEFEKLRKTVSVYAAVLFFFVFAGITGFYVTTDFGVYQIALFINGGVLAFLIIVGVLNFSRKTHLASIILNLMLDMVLFANVWLYLGIEIGILYLFVVLAILPFVTISRQYKFFSSYLV